MKTGKFEAFCAHLATLAWAISTIVPDYFAALLNISKNRGPDEN